MTLADKIPDLVFLIEDLPADFLACETFLWDALQARVDSVGQRPYPFLVLIVVYQNQWKVIAKSRKIAVVGKKGWPQWLLADVFGR